MLSTDVFKLQGASQISVGSQFAQRFTEQVGNNHQSHPSQSVPSITKELVLVLYTPGLCQTEDLGLRTSSASSFRKVQNVLLADQGHWCHFSGHPTPLLYQTHLYGASAPQLINVNHTLFWQFSIYPPEKQFFSVEQYISPSICFVSKSSSGPARNLQFLCLVTHSATNQAGFWIVQSLLYPYLSFLNYGNFSHYSIYS